MRAAIVVLGAVLVCGAASSSARAADNAPANGPEWCGFKDKAGSRVRCGYSSESDCKHAVGEPGAICIVDPYLTERRPMAAAG